MVPPDRNAGPRARRLRALAARHRGLLVILALHALVVALTAGRGSPWTTLSMDCLSGAIGETILHEPAWTPWSIIDGIVGGQVVTGTVALPLWALLGTANGLVGKVSAWLFCVVLLVLVYALVHRACGRAGAALAAAAVAFSPPLVFAGSMIASNWHWSELLFDYGAALLAIGVAWPAVRAPDRSTPHLGLAGLGLLGGLSIFNSPASMPFIALAWLIAPMGLGLRRSLVGLPAAALGAAVGLAPLFWRVMTFEPPTGGPDKGDPMWRRLFQFRPEWDKLGDLVYPELPVTLHLREAAPYMAGWAAGILEVAWVACCWGGCLLTLVFAVGALRKSERDGGAIAAMVTPLAFCAAFIAAYLVIDVRIELLGPEWSEFRQASHRIFPVLLVAMAVGSAPGWVGLYRLLAGVRGRRLRVGLQVLALVAALVPPTVGLLGQAGMAAGAPGLSKGALTGYRGNCFDIPGVFLAGRRQPVAELEAQCALLSTPLRQQDCLAGLALGIGFHAVRLAGEGEWPGDRDDDPCDRIAPSLGARCDSWSPEEQPVLEGDLEEVCRDFQGLRGELCLMGAGWFLSQVAWGRDHWPLPACDSLGSEPARDACWRGQGLQLADHLGFTPDRYARHLYRVPKQRRAAVARGGGYMSGRTWASEAIARLPCEALEPTLLEPCLAGIEDARSHSFSE